MAIMTPTTRVPPSTPTQSSASKPPATLPEIEIRFSPLYAWLLIGFGVFFFFMGLFSFSPSLPGRNVSLGILICGLSVAGVIGGNYWRNHLPVVIRMTSRNLVLPRVGAVDWSDIIAIDKKSLGISSYGARNSSEFVCFKLKNKPPQYKGLNEAFLKAVKSAVLGGYDVVINPQQELLRDADWFISECKKRMPTKPAA